MKKLLLMMVVLVVSMTVAAQTYNNPRQGQASKNLKVIKVERTSNSTVVYLKYTPENANTKSWINATPILTDEATGKVYTATAALNFKWGSKYVGTATYKIEFPPLPRNTSVVTFKESPKAQNGWVVRNIALPIQNNTSTTNKSATSTKPAASNNPPTNKPKVYDKNALLTNGYNISFENPSQTANNRLYKVTKVIRSNKSTIVHLRYTGQGSTGNVVIGSLVDYDTEKRWSVNRGLNFSILGSSYDGPYTFKIEYPAIPLSVSTLSIRVNTKTVVENIKVPIRTR